MNFPARNSTYLHRKENRQYTLSSRRERENTFRVTEAVCVFIFLINAPVAGPGLWHGVTAWQWESQKITRQTCVDCEWVFLRGEELAPPSLSWQDGYSPVTGWGKRYLFNTAESTPPPKIMPKYPVIEVHFIYTDIKIPGQNIIITGFYFYFLNTQT